ncbi:DUF6074 family protein [Agrobacterium vitis]|uniref:DUF6074 family protein n=1 Tax=Agrobacterium vitis TaxID=373 RepID=UPI000B2D481B|nr:DUF6074 family protein [Agrobacterium vitis]
MPNTAAKLEPVVSTLAFFPLASRRDMVRGAAVTLDRLQGNDATIYWRATCRQLGAELLDLGCPEDVMRGEIMNFQDAVQMELMWLHRNEEALG